jgi:SAM-dependent methyltransferase
MTRIPTATGTSKRVGFDWVRMTDDRSRWNEKYGDPEFELPEDPIPELERWIEALPNGRALDVATGTGRNALYLADRGHEVDAVDVSDEALELARKRAAERGVDVDWIRADLEEFDPEPDTYDVITVSFFAALEYLPDLKEALAPGGVLIYEHHLRSADDVEIGPSSKRHRYRSNDLLRACLDLTILHYEERVRTVTDGTAAVVTLIARNSSGGAQSYPNLTETDEPS